MTLLLVYALTLFLSATLLFLVQPMVARTVLPLLGGTPAVWNTCMLFFQVLLLLGYLYAHLSTSWLGVRRQASWHLLLMLLVVLGLPVALRAGAGPPTDHSPVPWLLLQLALSVGPPFFVLSASAPLLQKWFADTDHPAARDPYFLYGASNLGSMGALLSYPFVIEPRLRLVAQSWLWAMGYCLLMALCGLCALLLFRSRCAAAAPGPAAALPETRPTLRRRLRWIALSLLPSSFMLSVTTYLTTDIASIPLLWVVPLLLYLLTFILAFGRFPDRLHRGLSALLPLVILGLTLLLVVQHIPNIRYALPLNLVTFFLAALVCHGELARDRPSTRYLTEFYIFLSVGGALGGLVNTVMPLLTDRLLEYPLALVLTCLLLPQERGPLRQRLSFLMLGTWAILTVLLAGVHSGVPRAVTLLSPVKTWVDPQVLRILVLYGAPLVVLYTLVRHTSLYGLGIGVALLCSMVMTEREEGVIYHKRSYFGVLSVRKDEDTIRLLNGTTLHGVQSRDPLLRGEPLSYYHRQGPVGDMFRAFFGDQKQGRRFAFVGLGTGSLAAYGERGQEVVFYEIDPEVVRISHKGRFFTYLADARATVKVVLGDARISLHKAPDAAYDLILVDAFSSDAIPVHLLTREALQLYLRKLRPRGVIAFHISNRHLLLEPVVAALAEEAGLFAASRQDPRDGRIGKDATHYVVLSREQAALDPLLISGKWDLCEAQPGFPVWTDDYSNLIRIARWR